MGKSTVNILKSFNTGTVTATIAGGILGATEGKQCNIEYCYNIGNIVSKGSDYIGGIIGNSNNYISIKNSYNIGVVSVGDKTGGIAGLNAGNITNCYYLNTSASNLYGDNTGTIDTLSSAKTSDDLQSEAIVRALNSNTTETIYEQDTKNINNGYPILEWQKR